MTQQQPQPLKGSHFDLHTADLAGQYCALLLQSLGASTRSLQSEPDSQTLNVNCAKDWAESGLVPLTGYTNETPLQGPGAIPSCANGALDAIRLITENALLPGVTGASLLSERAAAMKILRQGKTSPNGSCHLLETSDGWIALNMAREDDWHLLPALLETENTIKDLPDIVTAVKTWPTQALVERGRLMGIPIAPAVAEAQTENWYKLIGEITDTTKRTNQPLVIDLSSLWAGPLCSHLLLESGCRVIKVESNSRLDGARRGPADFYHLINAGKQSITLNLSGKEAQQQLKQLLHKADIVIEGSRPRALQQMGIDPESTCRQQPGLIWLSLTGYGREKPQASWVAFGDDAAVAAGLATATATPPLFCGDAIGDPLTGLHATVIALAMWKAGMGGLIDLSLCNTTQYCLQFKQESLSQRGKVSGIEEQWQLSIDGHAYSINQPALRQPTAKAADAGADNHLLVELLAP